MSVGIGAEAGTLQGYNSQGSLEAVRPILALGVLGAGIVLNFAWMGGLGWVALRTIGLA